MKSVISKWLTVSLAVAIAVALPTAVKAQADSLVENELAIATIEENINTETNWCFRVPGYGWVCG